jgi:hypothetical protein
MEVCVQLELFNMEASARAALEKFCDEQVRRALQRDHGAVARATVTVRRDARRGVGERWTAQVELRLARHAAAVVRVDAENRRPHRAVEDAVVLAWSALQRDLFQEAS